MTVLLVVFEIFFNDRLEGARIGQVIQAFSSLLLAHYTGLQNT